MKKTNRRAAVLAGHKKQGSKFLPPFLSMSIPMTPTNWMDDIFPEMIWIALLRAQKPEMHAARLCIDLSKTANSIAGKRTSSAFATTSAFGKLTDEEWAAIVYALPSNQVEDLRGLLSPLVSLYPQSPFGSLYESNTAGNYVESTEQALSILRRAIGINSYRRGKEAMLTQRIFAFIPCAVGLMRFSGPSLVPNYASLDDYPDTDESRLAGSKVRAQVNAFIGMKKDEYSNEWCKYFWRQGYKISACEVACPPDGEHEVENKLERISSVLADIPEELEIAVQNSWLSAEIDVADNKKDEVLGGLLARQVRLTSQMTTHINLWALDLGLIVLRCMVDTYITFAWLCRFGTAKHFSDFIEYGLGQEKLLVEHFKAQSIDSASSPKEAKESEDWVEDQIMMHFLPVDVGDWIDKTKRKMAEELDAKDIYSLAFSPFSGAVHGMWHSIARVNLQKCLNPLHKFHRVPNFEPPPMHISAVLQAVDVMGRTLKAFCELKKLNIPPICEEALSNLKEIITPST